MGGFNGLCVLCNTSRVERKCDNPTVQKNSTTGLSIIVAIFSGKYDCGGFKETNKLGTKLGNAETHFRIAIWRIVLTGVGSVSHLSTLAHIYRVRHILTIL
jgi:hypothetical protein